MAIIAVPQSFLNDEERAAASNGSLDMQYVISKAESAISRLTDAVETAKAEARASSINYEQQFHQLENSCFNIQKELENLIQQHGRLKAENEELASRDALGRARIGSLEATVAEKQSTIARYQQTLEDLQQERKHLIEVLERRKADVQEKDADALQFAEKIREITRQKKDLLDQMTALQSENDTLRLETVKVRQEKQLLQKHNEWLDKELSARWSDMASLRSDKSASLVELQQRLDIVSDENRSLEEQVSRLRQRNIDLEKLSEERLQQLQTAKSEWIVAEEQYKTDISRHSRLAELYKSAETEAKKKLSDAQGALRELQMAYERVCTEKKEAAAKAEVAHKAVQEQLERTEHELRNVQGRFQDALSNLMISGSLLPSSGPHASAQSAATPAVGDRRPRQQSPDRERSESDLESKRRRVADDGSASAPDATPVPVSFLNLYSELMETKEQLRKEQAECERLNSCLNQILQEVERKAPILHEQKIEYENATRAHAELQQALEAAMQEIKLLRSEADAFTRDKAALERENRALRKETTDLSRQVQLLLKECQDLRYQPSSPARTLPPRSPAHTPQISRLISSASPAASPAGGALDADRVITDRLVDFRSIQELQEQNMKLLRLVRTLGEDMEKVRQEEQDRAKRSIADKLDAAMAELQNLREERSRQEDVMLAVVRQRDMYKAALAHAQSNSLSSPSQPTSSTPTRPSESTPVRGSADASASSPAPRRSSVGSADGTAAEYAQRLVELQREHKDYVKESYATERGLRTQVDKVREELSQVKTELVQVRYDKELLEQRHASLTSDANSWRRELEVLRKRDEQRSSATIDYERRINDLNIEANRLNNEIRKKEQTIENVTSEKGLVAQGEQRALHDKTVLMTERAKLQEHMDALQSALVAKEGSFQDRLRRATEQTDRAHAQWLDAKAQLDAERAHNRDVALSNERNLAELLRNMQERDQKIQELDAAYAEAKLKADRVAQLESRLKASEEKLSRLLGPENAAESAASTCSARQLAQGSAEASGPNMREKQLALELEDARIDLRRLREDKVQLEEQVAKLRSMVEATEKALREQVSAGDAYKTAMDSQLAAAREHAAALEQRVAQLTSSLDSTSTQLIAEKEALSARVQELQSSIEALTKQNAHYAETQRAIDAREAAFSAEIARQLALLQDTQAQLERHVLQHADALKRLHTAEAEKLKVQQEVAGMEERVRSVSQMHQDSQRSWEEQRRSLESLLETERKAAADLQLSNSLLHSQLEFANKQIVALSAKQPLSLEAGASSSASDVEGDEAKAMAELRELLRLLRHEKSVADTRYELAYAESSRLQHQVEQLQQALEQARAQLDDEQYQRPKRARTEAEHLALLKQIDELHVFRESNMVLRDELRQKSDVVSELQAQIQGLQARLGPAEVGVRKATEEVEVLRAEKQTLEKEVQSWRARVDSLVDKYKTIDPAEHRRLLEERKALNEKIEKMNADYEKLNAENKKLSEDVASKTAAVQTTRQQVLQNAQRQNNKLSEEIKAKQDEIERVQEAAKKKDEQLAQSADELLKLKEKLTATEAIIEKNSADVKQIPMMRKHIANQKKSLDDLKAQLKASQDQITKLTADLAAANGETESGKKQLADVQSELEQLRAAKTSAAAASAEVASELSNNAEQLTQARGEAEKARGEAEKARGEAEKARGETEKLRGQMATKEAKAKSYLDQFKALIEALRKDKTALEQEVQVLKAQVAALADKQDAAPADWQAVKAALEERVRELETRQDELLNARADGIRRELEMRHNVVLSMKDTQLKSAQRDKAAAEKRLQELLLVAGTASAAASISSEADASGPSPSPERPASPAAAALMVSMALDATAASATPPPFLQLPPHTNDIGEQEQVQQQMEQDQEHEVEHAEQGEIVEQPAVLPVEQIDTTDTYTYSSLAPLDAALDAGDVPLTPSAQLGVGEEGVAAVRVQLAPDADLPPAASSDMLSDSTTPVAAPAPLDGMDVEASSSGLAEGGAAAVDMAGEQPLVQEPPEQEAQAQAASDAMPVEQVSTRTVAAGGECTSGPTVVELATHVDQDSAPSFQELLLPAPPTHLALPDADSLVTSARLGATAQAVTGGSSSAEAASEPSPAAVAVTLTSADAKQPTSAPPLNIGTPASTIKAAPREQAAAAGAASTAPAVRAVSQPIRAALARTGSRGRGRGRGAAVAAASATAVPAEAQPAGVGRGRLRRLVTQAVGAAPAGAPTTPVPAPEHEPKLDAAPSDPFESSSDA